MRLIVHVGGGVLGGIGVGGQSLRVRTRLVVLLDHFCAGRHDNSSGADKGSSVMIGREGIMIAELYACPGGEVIGKATVPLEKGVRVHHRNDNKWDDALELAGLSSP